MRRHYVQMLLSESMAPKVEVYSQLKETQILEPGVTKPDPIVAQNAHVHPVLATQLDSVEAVVEQEGMRSLMKMHKTS